jgi:hypothetical protein
MEPRREIHGDAADPTGKPAETADAEGFSSGNGPALPRYGPRREALRPPFIWAARTGRDRVAVAGREAATANMP